MSIGYACLAVGVPNADFRTCVMKNAAEERLMEVTAQNLAALETLIDYNSQNDIRLFRISSDIIPFGSSPVNSLAWWDLFAPSLSRIGDKIRTAGMRVSMHPGQYTVLNSPTDDVVVRAVSDLDYHARFLDSLGTGPENKIILHIGGVYGDKDEAIRRFKDRYEHLEDAVKRRLVLENDERSYNICDVLKIAHMVGAPAVFDNLHHDIHPCVEKRSEKDWIDACKLTWKPMDGRQKIHYSQQEKGKRTGAHCRTIRIDEFLSFYKSVHGENLDIMLEVKDKNLSAVKCINCTTVSPRLNRLELDWSRYKYLVLEHTPAIYLEIRELLKDRNSYPAVEFYQLIESAMQEEIDRGNAENSALHVWGYFKKTAAENEREQFFHRLDLFRQGVKGTDQYKNYLLRLAQKYDQEYLMESLYFYI